jgi:phenylalanyl-tRNA synthetase beta chain
MKISYQWLRDLTGLDWSAEKMADRLTLAGTACESIESTARYFDNVMVGQVTNLSPVEGASKIQKATVNLGSTQLDLVCGAPNVAIGQKVPVALVGAKIADGLEIKKVTIRGIESAGMICSESELGISSDHSGILVLDDTLEIGKPLVEALDYEDYQLDFELTPNRADSMSAVGIARDLAALASIRLKMPEYDIKESKKNAADLIQVSIDDTDGCPRYAARLIQKVTVGESPWWLKKRLLSSGIRPISNVVDITNFIMLETGNPLHAFDLKEFGSNEVVVRAAREGEEFITLDGDEHTLTADTLLITNGREGVAAAGVMGGLHSGISEETTTVLLEAAYFNPARIRRSRRKLNVVTESSTRFEKGVDPNNVPVAMNRAAYLMQELCGGQVAAGTVDCYPEPIMPKTLTMRPKRCNNILGTDVSAKRMVQILSDLEFEVHGENPIKATVPTFRHDMEREIDLIEEVARIEGYDKIENATANVGPLYTPTHIVDRFAGELRRFMTAAGFDEMVGHGLDSSKLAAQINPELPQLRLINPISEELDIVRNSLIPTALGSVSHNIAHRNLDLRFFEIGQTYFPPDSDGNWKEDSRLVIAVTGETEHSWREKPRPLDFYDLSGVLSALASRFKLEELSFKPVDAATFNSDCSFDIYSGTLRLGKAGRVSEKIARVFDIKQSVFMTELSLEHIRRASSVVTAFAPLPVFPAALRDLALVVDKQVPVGEIIKLVRASAGDDCESVQLFDLYDGQQIVEGKKSVALAITFRSGERSLANVEVDKYQLDIVSSLKKHFNAEIRDN